VIAKNLQSQESKMRARMNQGKVGRLVKYRVVVDP